MLPMFGCCCQVLTADSGSLANTPPRGDFWAMLFISNGAMLPILNNEIFYKQLYYLLCCCLTSRDHPEMYTVSKIWGWIFCDNLEDTRGGLQPVD